MRVRLALAATIHPPGPPGSRAAAVVIDVLRATTSLTMAMAGGAKQIVAASTPAEAIRLRERIPDALLCGEREGLRLPGFDLANSPYEFTPDVVAGRTLIFASTNGSIALLAAAGARCRWLAAFINLATVLDVLAGEEEVIVIASGKLGRFSIEDAACAGLLCRRLEERGATLKGAAARFAKSIAPSEPGEVRSLVQGSPHGRYLRTLGPAFARDVDFCSELDGFEGAYQV